MSSLMHHGVKGQRWGVRRFQNKDGTRTPAGKKHYSVEAVDADSTRSDIKKLVNNFSRKDKQMFFDRHYPNEKYDKGNEVVAKRFVVKEGKDIVAFIDANERWTSDNLNIVIGTSKSARGKGYASVLSKKMVDWYEEEGHKKHGMLEWNAYEENVGSRKAAEKAGFKQISSGYDQTAHYVYSKTSKKELNNLSTAYRNKSSVEKEVSDKINSDFQKTKFSKFTPKTTISAYGSAYTPYDSELGFYKSMIIDRHASKWAKKHHSEDIARYDKATSDWSSAYETFNKKRRRIKHTSIGGTMYIEGNALILGDSSYLEHHGIRGQRWGVRRFQNRDGSLTNAGRKRLGYATKGVTQTVGKAFKAGVKAGGNAVKAVKAHHEKAEAKKKEKKKEKASKTRLGVMANKDLFTNEEIRKLNERFKLEDEMKMATLQKGVEIAKAVGTIAQNVGTMAKAYEDVTGQSLSPIKRKAAEEKVKQDAEDRKRKLAKEDAETKRAEDKEKRDIEDRERRIKLEDEDRVRKQAKEDADAQRAENAEKRAQAKEQRDSSMAVELQRKAKAAADEQEHKAVKAKAESRSAILDVLEKIDKIQDHDDDDHSNPPGGGIDTWDDDDYLNFFKKTGIIHSDISDPSIIQNGVLFIDSSDSLAHHGVKGQRWGVRKFQNADGSLTEKGRKHYEKALAKEKRKQASSDAIRGTLERQHPFAVTGAAIMGAVAAGMSIAATGGASVAMIAAGSAITGAVSAGLTHVSYSASEAWEGRGTRMRSKKIDKYENILKQSDGENGMYHVENGTLFINAGEPYLEHHGVLGMKWGKHLRAGKGPADAPASAGGGSGEDDEKLKEMAKKAGMSVAEYRQKFASKLGGAASKVGEKVYDAAGGSHKKNAEGWRKMAQDESNAARASEKKAHDNSARAASQDRKYGSGGDVYRRAADSDKENAETHRSNAKVRSERAASEQAAYEKSLVGKYDKMKAAGKRARKAGNELSAKAAAAKKRLKDAPGELYGSKHRKDFERNARLLEGSTRSAVEIGRDTYKRHGPTSGFGDPTYKATDDAYKRANKQWNKARVSGQKYDRSIAKRVDSLARKVSIARKTTEQKKLFSGTSPKAKKAVIAKKKATPTSYEKRINDAKNSVEKAARSNEAAYKHATEVYRQTGRDSDAYRQAIKRSQTTLWRSLDNQERLKQKKRRPADIGKKRAKHFDNTNAIYTEGTRLVVNSKWG